MIKTFLIGRGENCDFVVNDKFVSREHLQLVVDEKKTVFLVDLGSKTGTSIDGHTVESKKLIELKKHNIVRIGESLVPWEKIIHNYYIVQEPPTGADNLLNTTFDKNIPLQSQEMPKKTSFFSFLKNNKNSS